MKKEKRVHSRRSSMNTFVAADLIKMYSIPDNLFENHEFEVPAVFVFEIANKMVKGLEKFDLVDRWSMSCKAPCWFLNTDIFFDPNGKNYETKEPEPHLIVKISADLNGVRLGYDWIGNENPTDVEINDEKNWKKISQQG